MFTLYYYIRMNTMQILTCFPFLQCLHPMRVANTIFVNLPRLKSSIYILMSYTLHKLRTKLYYIGVSGCLITFIHSI